jgi:hypothetical protein
LCKNKISTFSPFSFVTFPATMDPDTGPDSPPRTPGNPSTQSAMDLDSEPPLQSSPDPLNEPHGHKPLNTSHKRHNSSQDQLSQSCHQRNSIHSRNFNHSSYLFRICCFEFLHLRRIQSIGYVSSCDGGQTQYEGRERLLTFEGFAQPSTCLC